MGENYIRIENNFKLQSGFAFPSSAFVDDGIPIVRMSDLKSGRLKFENTKYVGQGWLKSSATFSLKEDDFLVGMSGSLSNYAVVRVGDVPALLNQRVGRLQSKSGKQSYEYACYWLKSIFYERYAEIQGEGAAQKNISSKQIEAFKYRWVSLGEQVKIVKVLQTIDQTIEKTEALIEKYQQIKAGLMHDLFTRGIGPDDKLRPPRERAPELYQKTSIGWIPKEWVLHIASNFITAIDAGKSPECPDIPASADQWGVLKVSAVSPDGLRQSENKVVEKFEHQNPNYIVKRGDLLITRANTPELVGMICYVDLAVGKLILSDKTLRLHTDENRVDKRYLYWAFQHPETRKQIEICATGSSGSMKNISQKDIRGLKVALPRSLNEQEMIRLRLDSALQKIGNEKIAKSKLVQQKSGLMYDLLTGKVQVNPDALKAVHV
ncbi:hypothetical protein DJ030_06800 [bacterium endosymbiont of Escarpia laminata]|nr:MAG: hypothetical protein DJ030_06800 [bacterium endosymbiont of Escarpia laminata]